MTSNAGVIDSQRRKVFSGDVSVTGTDRGKNLIPQWTVRKGIFLKYSSYLQEKGTVVQ